MTQYEMLNMVSKMKWTELQALVDIAQHELNLSETAIAEGMEIRC